MNKVTEVPSSILEFAKKYFDQRTIQEAKKLIMLSRVSISFHKGSPESYFIVSGIVKTSSSYEAKAVYKKRNEGTDTPPVTTNCHCHDWTEESHCPHSCCLFL